MTTNEFKIGDRVKVKDEAVDRYVVAFAKFIKGRPATVVSTPSPDSKLFRLKVRLEWDVKRNGGKPKVEWIDQRDVEHLEAEG